MRKVLLFLISLFIGISLLVGVVRFIGWEEIQPTLVLFTGWQGLVIILLTLSMLFLGMWRWGIILKSQGYGIPKKQLAAPYLAGFSLIYFIPLLLFGGEIFRAYYLREKFNVPWRKGIISGVIDRILEGTAYLVIIIIGVAFFLFKIGLPPQNIAILLGSFIFLFTTLIGFFYFKSFKKQSIAKFFAKILKKNKFFNGEALEIEKEVFRFFKLKNKVFWQGLLLAFSRVAVALLRCWLLLLFLGKVIGFLPALSVLGFYYFILFIPIPAALGTHELIQAFSFSALKIGAGIAPAFTMIQRGAEVALALIGIVIFFRLGIELIKTIIFKKTENLINRF